MATECARHVRGLICMPEDVLQELCNDAGVDPKQDPKALLEQLLAAYKVESEAALFELPRVSQLLGGGDNVTEILDRRFKIPGHWHSVALMNDHIDKTLDQWEEAHPDFCNIGFSMLNFADYDGMPSQLIKNFATLYAGKGAKFIHHDIGDNERIKAQRPFRRFSIVINSDRLGGCGKHWTCIFIDCKTKALEFFNSSGNSPYPEILDWATEFISAVGQTCELRFVPVTSIRHQKGGVECGMYCLNYIDQRLQGVSPDAFKHDEVPDTKMTALRQRIFRQV